jgi:hypothetical protein
MFSVYQKSMRDGSGDFREPLKCKDVSRARWLRLSKRRTFSTAEPNRTLERLGETLGVLHVIEFEV